MFFLWNRLWRLQCLLFLTRLLLLIKFLSCIFELLSFLSPPDNRLDHIRLACLMLREVCPSILLELKFFHGIWGQTGLALYLEVLFCRLIEASPTFLHQLHDLGRVESRILKLQLLSRLLTIKYERAQRTLWRLNIHGLRWLYSLQIWLRLDWIAFVVLRSCLRRLPLQLLFELFFCRDAGFLFWIDAFCVQIWRLRLAQIKLLCHMILQCSFVMIFLTWRVKIWCDRRSLLLLELFLIVYEHSIGFLLWFWGSLSHVLLSGKCF